MCSRKQRKNKWILKDFLGSFGEGVSVRSVVINGAGWVFAVSFESETVYKCLLAENINICPKHLKIAQFQKSILFFMHHPQGNFTIYY